MTEVKEFRCLSEGDLYSILDEALMEDAKLQLLMKNFDPRKRVRSALIVFRGNTGYSPYYHVRGTEEYRIDQGLLSQFRVVVKSKLSSFIEVYLKL